MSDDDAQPPSPRRARLLWTLLGAMVLVGLVPLVVSHYFLIRINRDSLETLERKYLSRATARTSASPLALLRRSSACAASASAFATKGRATSPRSSSTATAECSCTASRRSRWDIPIFRI